MGDAADMLIEDGLVPDEFEEDRWLEEMLRQERRRVYEEMLRWKDITYFGDDDYGSAVGRVMRELQRICGVEDDDE